MNIKSERMNNVLQWKGVKLSWEELLYDYMHMHPPFKPKIIRNCTNDQIIQFRNVFKFKRMDIKNMKSELNSWLKEFPEFFDYNFEAIINNMKTKRENYLFINENPKYGGIITEDKANEWEYNQENSNEMQD